MTTELQFGPYTVALTRENKVLFPEAALTKGDLVDYYRAVGDVMLPHLADRPVTMHRFPDGIEAEGFYQKDVPEHFPDWIERVEVKKEGGSLVHAVCSNLATLVYLANQAVVTPHVWLSRVGSIEKPDQIVFDLDPPEGGTDFGPVKDAALTLRDLLSEIGLVPFVKTTGSKGLHVVSPLDAEEDFDAVRAFAGGLAEVMAHRHPGKLTTEQRIESRAGRVFIDTLHNAYGQTVAAPYAVRPRKRASVATPVTWDELASGGVTADGFTVESVPNRLDETEDPWKGMGRSARSLAAPRERLASLREAQ